MAKENYVLDVELIKYGESIRNVSLDIERTVDS
jgi:hypothetical protein